MPTPTKKLYRSRTNKMIAGVCGGIGKYLNTDPTIIRLGFVVISFMSGVGVILYLALWIIVPLEGEAAANLDREHLNQVGGEMKAKAEEVVGEIKKTVEGLKKKKDVTDDNDSPPRKGEM